MLFSFAFVGYVELQLSRKLNNMLSPRRVEPILVITLYIYHRLTVSLILCLVPSRLIDPMNEYSRYLRIFTYKIRLKESKLFEWLQYEKTQKRPTYNDILAVHL